MRRSWVWAPLVSAMLLAVPAPCADPKVVIIGFDGADAGLVERWMDEGELPNLSQLREDGTFAPLQPTNPPQTPVSWSSFATGTDPGKTEIFDFLTRDPGNYLPDFGMITEGRKPFMFGDRNAMMLGLIAGFAALLLAVLVQLALSNSWRSRLIAAGVVAVAVGATFAYVGDRYLPAEVPDAQNRRKGETMWELASEAGLTAHVIRVPATFPADEIPGGQLLSGLGVPDMRGRIGTPAFYTSDPRFNPGDNEFSLELIRLPERRGKMKTRVFGPANKPFYDYVIDQRLAELAPEERGAAKRRIQLELDDQGVASRIDLLLDLEVDTQSARITVGKQSATLAPGEWSEWFEFDFPVNAVVDFAAPLKGLGRFKLLQLEPEVQLYLSPINFHPDCHPVAFSYPADYSEELEDEVGLYKTLGWALDTWSLPSGVGDEELFLEDMQFTVDKYEEVMEASLGRGDQDLYVQIFYFTDRIGHLFWRFMDPGHPQYDAGMAERYSGEMLKAYKRMDEMVGKARALAGPEALFIVCSDHGFTSYRRGVNYNNWLVENDLLVLKGAPGEKATLEKLFDTRELFQGVDWSKTKAYALGLGGIYINRMGRERQGIVMPGPEYEAVRQQIKEGLEGLVDPITGEHPVARVWLREELYETFDPSLIPDLRASNNENYRVSWQTTLGGFGETVVEDNTNPWSGDHCSNDPDQVLGIFFSNLAIQTTMPNMIDIMPTVLTHLGIEIPEEVDGKSLL